MTETDWVDAPEESGDWVDAPEPKGFNFLDELQRPGAAARAALIAQSGTKDLSDWDRKKKAFAAVKQGWQNPESVPSLETVFPPMGAASSNEALNSLSTWGRAGTAVAADFAADPLTWVGIPGAGVAGKALGQGLVRAAERGTPVIGKAAQFLGNQLRSFNPAFAKKVNPATIVARNQTFEKAFEQGVPNNIPADYTPAGTQLEFPELVQETTNPLPEALYGGEPVPWGAEGAHLKPQGQQELDFSQQAPWAKEQPALDKPSFQPWQDIGQDPNANINELAQWMQRPDAPAQPSALSMDQAIKGIKPSGLAKLAKGEAQPAPLAQPNAISNQLYKDYQNESQSLFDIISEKAQSKAQPKLVNPIFRADEAIDAGNLPGVVENLKELRSPHLPEEAFGQMEDVLRKYEEASKQPFPFVPPAKEVAFNASLRKTGGKIKKAEKLRLKREQEMKDVGVTPEDIIEPTAMQDMLTVLKEFNEKGSTGVGAHTPEGRAALERLRTKHADALAEHMKEPGATVASYVAKNMGQLDKTQQRQAVSLLSIKETPITTKLNPKGQQLGQYHNKMNVSVFKDPEVAGEVMNLLDENPKLSQTTKITNAELLEMAKDIDTAPIFQHIVNSRGGALATQLLFKSQKSASAVASFLKAQLPESLSAVGDELAEMAKGYLGDVKKVKTELGRALQSTQIPVEVQADLNAQFTALIEMVKKDKTLQDRPELIRKIKVFRDSVVSSDLNPSMWDKAYYIWMNSILSGPPTQVFAGVSNAAQIAGKYIDRALEAAWDKFVLYPFTKQRAVTGDELGKLWTGMFKGTKDLPEELLHKSSKAIENVPLLKPVKNAYAETLNQLGSAQLGRTDAAFGNRAASMEWEALKDKVGLTKQDVIDLVTDESKRITFTRDPGALAKMTSYLKKNFKGVRWIMPFTRSPADIAGQGFDLTVPGAATRLGREAYHGNYSGPVGQRKLAHDLTRATQATALLLWTMNKFKDGDITGNAEASAAERDNTQNIQHRPPNSLRFSKNGKWHSYQPYEPLATALSVTVDAINGYYDKEAPEDVYGRIVYALDKSGKAFLNKRYLTGVQNLMGAASGPGNFVGRSANQIAGGFVPGAAKFVRDAVDTTQRQVTNPVEAAMNRFPWASKSLRPALDAFGRPITKPSSLDISGRSGKQTRAERAAAGQSTSKPGKAIGDLKLTAEEYDQLVRSSGKYKQQLYDKLADQMSSRRPAIRERMGSAINAAANERARAEFKIPRMKNKKLREEMFPFLKQED